MWVGHETKHSAFWAYPPALALVWLQKGATFQKSQYLLKPVRPLQAQQTTLEDSAGLGVALWNLRKLLPETGSGLHRLLRAILRTAEGITRSEEASSTTRSAAMHCRG